MFFFYCSKYVSLRIQNEVPFVVNISVLSTLYTPPQPRPTPHATLHFTFKQNRSTRGGVLLFSYVA